VQWIEVRYVVPLAIIGKAPSRSNSICVAALSLFLVCSGKRCNTASPNGKRHHVSQVSLSQRKSGYSVTVLSLSLSLLNLSLPVERERERILCHSTLSLSLSLLNLSLSVKRKRE